MKDEAEWMAKRIKFIGKQTVANSESAPTDNSPAHTLVSNGEVETTTVHETE